MPLSFRQKINRAAASRRKFLKSGLEDEIKNEIKNIKNNVANDLSKGMIDFVKKAIPSGVAYTKTKDFLAVNNATTSSGQKDNYLAFYLAKIRKMSENEQYILDSPDIRDIMLKILNAAKRNTPVDKRYIGYKDSDKSQMTLQMPKFRNLKERVEGLKPTEDDKNIDSLMTGEQRMKRTTSGRAMYDKYIAQMGGGVIIDTFNINSKNFSGDYRISEEKKDYLKKMLSGGRKSEEKRFLWYNKEKKSINYYKVTPNPKTKLGSSEFRNTVIATFFEGKEGDLRYSSSTSGGEEELKRSGEYDKKTHTISFDPRRLGAKYNYAAIQHNNLLFDHGHNNGGPMFLYNAYMQYRKELAELVKERLTKIRQEALENAKRSRQDEKAKKQKLKPVKKRKGINSSVKNIEKTFKNTEKHSKNVLNSLKKSIK